MLGALSSVGTTWVTRNASVLLVFAPLLVVTGVLGFTLPPHLSLMSGATPYNVFHLVSGAAGLVILARRSLSGAVAFNLVFGCIDLWQAVAGVTGLFPARWFALRPADHVVHLLVGVGLVAVGYLGKKSRP
ncbi:MAG: hypothetical protein EOO73_18235 [Myxococcales bacterium]|nr:MAG: hypothetical protein EOO73_18235 [Myxococcales bacterium]